MSREKGQNALAEQKAKDKDIAAYLRQRKVYLLKHINC
jgi:hypothetical protein